MSLARWMYRSERWMYADGHPNRVATILNRGWSIVGRAGVWARLVTLEVPGRSSGRVVSCPLVVVRHAGERYLVAMLGERAQWVRNVRAAGGRGVLRHRNAESVVLVEVPAADRAPILRRHLDVAPAARSFFPFDRQAPLSEFASVAGGFPVFRIAAAVPSEEGDTKRVARSGGSGSRRGGRRGRRRLAAVTILLVGAVAVALVAVGAYLRSAAEPPLALPAPVSAPAGPLAGTWTASAGSMAGFRIAQTVLGMTGEVAGRTNAVTGSATIAADSVTSGTFEVDLTTITAGGKPSPQFAATLETARFPTASFRLTEPVALTAAFAAGAPLAIATTGEFTLHGVTRAVTVTIAARRDGSRLDVSGSIPIVLSDWGMRTPAGYGALGSLADRGAAEFLLALQHD